jgi:ribose/xylose/arabinose/galactoside ABC-type transport system permease subunit
MVSTKTSFYGVPLATGLVIMGVVGIAVGALNSLFVWRVGVAPLIVTLATRQITSGIAYQFTREGEMIGKLTYRLASLGQGH